MVGNRDFAPKLPQVDPEERIKAGSNKVEFLPATSIFNLRQIRETYDSAKLEELADSITVEDTESGGISLDLINAGWVAQFNNLEALVDYLKNHAKYYEYEYDEALIDQIPFVNGKWNIRENGHRRGKAIQLKCDQLGIPIEQVDIICTIHENPSFDTARGKQYHENRSDAILPAEDAKAMEREYKYRWGEKPAIVIERSVEKARIKEIAKFMGFGEAKVESGLLYSAVPDEIKAFEKRGLTYTNVVQLAMLHRAYANQKDIAGFPTQTEQEAYEMMHEYFKSQITNRLKGKNAAVISEKLKAKIREVNKESEYLTGELFLVDEQTEKRNRRRRIDRGLVEAMILLVDTGVADFDVDDLVEVERVLAKVQERLGVVAAKDAEAGVQEELGLSADEDPVDVELATFFDTEPAQV